MNNDLESKFRTHFGVAKQVKYASYDISEEPMFSEDYRDCNGVVLLGHKRAALSHFSRIIDVESGKPAWFGPYTTKVYSPGGETDYHEIDPRKYLEEMFEEMVSQGEREMQAVLLGGDPTHFEINKKFLEEKRIPIVGQYLDGWKERNGEFLKTHSGKNLVVLPTLQEVIMYSNNEGYGQLAPNPF